MLKINVFRAYLTFNVHHVQTFGPEKPPPREVVIMKRNGSNKRGKQSFLSVNIKIQKRARLSSNAYWGVQCCVHETRQVCPRKVSFWIDLRLTRLGGEHKQADYNGARVGF